MARRQAELEEYTTSKLRRSKGESFRGITTRLGKGYWSEVAEEEIRVSYSWVPGCVGPAAYDQCFT